MAQAVSAKLQTSMTCSTTSFRRTRRQRSGTIAKLSCLAEKSVATRIREIRGKSAVG